MNADKFQDAYIIYEYEFKTVLEFIIQCYDLMLSKYSGLKIENNENKIRNRLYKDFLNSNTIKANYDLFPCRFECESAEIDEEYEEVGYSDIKVLTSVSLTDSDAYYIIECKRLDGSKRLNNEYIKEGIYRFIDNGKYPSYSNLSGMIGFIVSKIDTNDNIEVINDILKKSTIRSYQLLENDLCKRNIRYSSAHEKENKSILKIYHLMLDYSTITS